MPDLATVIPLAVSILGALGIGSAFGQWIAASKDRRANRAAVLDKLRRVEELRWTDTGDLTGGPTLLSAVRDLEVAALLARIPRSVVLQYGQLAVAGLWTMHDDIESGKHPEEVGLDIDMSNAIHAAAEVVSRAAWSTPASRWLWLRRHMRRTEKLVEKIEDRGFRRQVASARHSIR